MPFTPDHTANTLIIRSVEYGDGSEFNDDGDSTNSLDIIPDHYVIRLWRKPAIETSSGGKKVIYINKSPSSSDRSVAFSTVEERNSFSVRKGDGATEMLRVEWEGSGLKAMERSSVTIENQTTTVRNFLRTSSTLLSSSQSRIFQGPDGLEYKWKVIYCGTNPAYPDYWYLELHTKDSKVPVATSARLARRDGHTHEESHPVYIAERGLRMTPWIIGTFALTEKLVAASS
ncbi:hypothetical protein PQX77_009905 [Marasmius sp. AFHP31]|nr:hypothetical protein PQX77_009905 [Marasmius sp. AFHP31]